MLKACLLVYVEDSALKKSIRKIAVDKKVEAYFATRGDQLAQMVKNFAALMLIVDLSGLDTGWLFRHISSIEDYKSGFPIVALVGDDQEAAYAKAESYGCRFVLTKSKFLAQLPGAIEKVFRNESP